MTSSFKNDFTTVLLNSIESDDESILHVSSSMLRSLNNSVYLSRLVSSRHINTSKLRSRSWIELTFESFRVFSASTICLSTRNFLTLVIAFSMIFARWVINDVDEFIACIREYVSNINKISTSSFELTMSLIVFMIIWSAISLLTFFSRFSMIIWYARRSSAWYLSTTPIDQWASIEIDLMKIVIDVTNWRNSLLTKFFPTSINMWSENAK